MIPVSRIAFEVGWGLIPLCLMRDVMLIEMVAKEQVLDFKLIFSNHFISNLEKILVWFDSKYLSHTEPGLHPRHRRSWPKMKLVLIHNHAKR